jgi:DNA primase
MPNNAVDYLKENINVLELLKLYGVDNYTGTSKVRCKCPIHGGNNPTSFVYDVEKKLWFCHSGCYRGGDIFDFIMMKENLSFMQSVHYLAELFKFDISSMTIEMRTIDYIQDTRKWIQQMTKHTTVQNIEEYDITQLGKLYGLNSYRNFTEEILDYFMVKYCEKAVICDKISKKEIYVTKRIVVPIYYNDILIGVTMRKTLKHDSPKWLHQPSGIYMGNYIYNINKIKQDKPIMIVEGCGDVWNAYQNGYENTVGMFGAHMTDTQKTILLSTTYELILALDPDYAGIKAMQNIWERLRLKMNIRFLNVPIGQDVGDLTKEKTSELLNNTLSHIQWLQLEHVNDIVDKNINMKGWIQKWIVNT